MKIPKKIRKINSQPKLFNVIANSSQKATYTNALFIKINSSS